MIQSLERLASDFRLINPDMPYSLGGVSGDYFFVPLYVNGDSRGGACINFGFEKGVEVFIPYGYASKGPNRLVTKAEHTCRANLTLLEEGALHFLDNLVKFDTGLKGAGSSFQVVPQLLLAINESERKVGITNSPLKDKYFGILYNELKIALNGLKEMNYEVDSGSLHSLGGLLANTMNMELTPSEERKIYQLMNNIEHLGLINAILNDNELMTTGLDGLRARLTPLKDGLEERLRELNNKFSISKPAKIIKKPQEATIYKRESNDNSIIQGIIKKYELNIYQNLKDGQITTLDLSKKRINYLNEVPGLFQLTNLKKLISGVNELTQLPESIGKLTKLEGLGLALNKLTYLPDSIKKLTNLREISIMSNQFTETPYVEQLKKKGVEIRAIINM